MSQELYQFGEDTRQGLEKANFEMKMKLFYLEDEMKRLKSNGYGSNLSDVETLRSEAESLRLLLQEKTLELDQRK